MFEALGRVTYRRRRWVVAAAVGFLVFAGVWGTQVFGALQGGGFEDPASESTRAVELAEAQLGRDGSDVVVLYSSDELTVDDPAFRDAVTGTLEALPDDAVVGAVSYYGTQDERFVSEDRRSTYAVLELADLGEGRGEVLEQVRGELDAPGLTTRVG